MFTKKTLSTYSDDNTIVLNTPFEKMTKKEIAEEGVKYGMIPSKTYSCYEGKPTHCGKCGTCVERIWALQDVDDDTKYEDKEFAIEVLKKEGEWNAN